MQSAERWVQVQGHEGAYEVSDAGRVRSVDRMIYPEGHKPYFRAGKILKPRLDRQNGYLIVTLAGGTARVHRLVAEAYVDGQAEGLEVCHSNGDKADNAASNLRWDTHLANIADKMAHGSHHYAKRQACGRGHAYTEETMYVYKGKRVCRVCSAIRWRKRDELRRASKMDA